MNIIFYIVLTSLLLGIQRREWKLVFSGNPKNLGEALDSRQHSEIICLVALILI